MFYKLLFLPSNEPFTDGCLIVDQSGNLHIYNETEHTEATMRHYKVAEPWLVRRQYNIEMPVGRPSPKALRWLKNGDQVKAIDCEMWFYNTKTKMFECPMTPDDAISADSGLVLYCRVKCPCCGDLH